MTLWLLQLRRVVRFTVEKYQNLISFLGNLNLYNTGLGAKRVTVAAGRRGWHECVSCGTKRKSVERGGRCGKCIRDGKLPPAPAPVVTSTGSYCPYLRRPGSSRRPRASCGKPECRSKARRHRLQEKGAAA